ncbi:MAG: superoxide dismutase [Betaproteobacteria bacterium]|nr:MAG: superoxide dismutase [Betaproteobacteria bacterium]
MPLTLPSLPYDHGALEPFVSATTLKLHHSVHHAGYVDRVNALVRDTNLQGLPLRAIVERSAGDPRQRSLFNNAAQAWNHAFFWRSLHAAGKRNSPSPRLAARIARDLGGQAQLIEQLKSAALSVFGSGWAWLVERDGRLCVETTANADCPITTGAVPGLVIDVWEHAYYLDYQARRADYVSGVLGHLLDWGFAEQNLLAKEAQHA